MSRPVVMYNEASVPTVTSTWVFVVHMAVIAVGIAFVFEAPSTIFGLKVRLFSARAILRCF